MPVASLQEILDKNRTELEQCNWYYKNLKWNESAQLLANTEPGTFLVRDSADPNFLFSLSVQRGKSNNNNKTDNEGPTSVRIHFQRGKFRLDAEESIRHLMPEFDSVVALIEHYMSNNKNTNSSNSNPYLARLNGSQVFVDNLGKLSSPICLKKPLYKEVPSLSHLSRLVICGAMAAQTSVDAEKKTQMLDLPLTLKTFVRQYPYRV